VQPALCVDVVMVTEYCCHGDYLFMLTACGKTALQPT